MAPEIPGRGAGRRQPDGDPRRRRRRRVLGVTAAGIAAVPLALWIVPQVARHLDSGGGVASASSSPNGVDCVAATTQDLTSATFELPDNKKLVFDRSLITTPKGAQIWYDQDHPGTTNYLQMGNQITGITEGKQQIVITLGNPDELCKQG
jgi:hypothetical protein